MNETQAPLSRDEAGIKESTAPRPTDDLAPLALERTSAAQIEIRTLVQLLEGVGVELADKALAAMQNDGWEVLDISVNTVVEYLDHERVATTAKLRTVRVVTLMRPLDGNEGAQEADAAAKATATVQIPTIVIAAPEPEHQAFARTIVGRGVSFAQASAEGTYTDDELGALRQFELAAQFVPVRVD